MGQLVATFPILAGHDEYNFDISFLSQGLYVWHLRIDEKTRQSGRLVKIE
jgi:hypothetical protein